MPVDFWEDVVGHWCERCKDPATHEYGTGHYLCCGCHAPEGDGLVGADEVREAWTRTAEEMRLNLARGRYAVNEYLQKLDAIEQRIERALNIAFQFAQVDHPRHKAWVIDQMVRTLLRDSYNEWVKDYRSPVENAEGELEDMYEWDTGVAPCP